MTKIYSNEFQFTSVKVLPCASLPSPNVETKKPAPCCSTCGKKAKIFVSQVDGVGNVKKKSFCLSHAIEAGLFHPKAWDLLGAKPAATNGLDASPRPETRCRCGMSEGLLKLKGRVGCAHCYTTFAALIAPLLPQLQPANVHAGKAPAKAAPRVRVRTKIEELERAMRRAITQEAYEEAAEVRDQLAALRK